MSMLIILKTDYFKVLFFYKSELCIYTAGKNKGLFRNKHFKIKKTQYILPY